MSRVWGCVWDVCGCCGVCVCVGVCGGCVVFVCVCVVCVLWFVCVCVVCVRGLCRVCVCGGGGWGGCVFVCVPRTFEQSGLCFSFVRLFLLPRFHS